MPTGVARSFEILIPVVVIVLTLHPLNLIIESTTGMILPEAIMHLLSPLVAASDSLPAILISVLICQILWFAGIHGSLIVTGIMNPFWMANLSANQAALAAGQALPHIYLQGFWDHYLLIALAAGAALPHTYLQGFWDHYLLIGGVGCTLPLAFLLLKSRATHLRTIGKMGIVPSFFNINEPIFPENP
ncbi:PTS system, cellobiose-specific IIC component [Cronobacter sakazakii 701]|nr:PTS system, cellobiose-specific IIC component [Cronobacter sakazakii 701]